MDMNKTDLERAFEIAAEGGARHINDIRAQLKKEGYATFRIHGPSLIKQLRDIMEKVRPARTA
jgi:hypothetical protein